jgi:hypothetical protein
VGSSWGAVAAAVWQPASCAPLAGCGAAGELYTFGEFYGSVVSGFGAAVVYVGPSVRMGDSSRFLMGNVQKLRQ